MIIIHKIQGYYVYILNLSLLAVQEESKSQDDECGPETKTCFIDKETFFFIEIKVISHHDVNNLHAHCRGGYRISERGRGGGSG